MNDLDKVFKEVLGDEHFKAVLREKIAEHIVAKTHHRDIEGLLLNDEIRATFKETIAKMIEDYFENYYEAYSIDTQVEKAIQSLTKDKVVELLAKRLV